MSDSMHAFDVLTGAHLGEMTSVGPCVSSGEVISFRVYRTVENIGMTRPLKVLLVYVSEADEVWLGYVTKRTWHQKSPKVEVQAVTAEHFWRERVKAAVAVAALV